MCERAAAAPSGGGAGGPFRRAQHQRGGVRGAVVAGDTRRFLR